MELKMWTVDSFTKETFGGNPAAVTVVAEPLSDDVCQKIAAEMNLSETAFITGLKGGDGDFTRGSEFGLRWWTPAKEVTLCGHATLAAAHVLFHILHNENPQITFHSKFSGKLMVSRLSDGSIQMDFPLNFTRPIQLETQPVARAMSKAAIGDANIVGAAFADDEGFANLILELPPTSRAHFENMVVEPSDVLATDPEGKSIRLLTLTMKAEDGDGDLDFYDRVIAPYYGIPEDPVTGSAHSPLADYWFKRTGKAILHGRQCSKRGGLLRMEVKGDRVFISGHSVHVLTGQFRF